LIPWFVCAEFSGLEIVQSAFSFEIAAGRVQAIYIICNPDKLRHLAIL